jgi:hypothetical protein
MRISSWLAMACAAALSGCATYIDGTQQYITVNSPPTGYAHCVLTRPGESFNVTTPGSIHIAKSSDDLTIRCARPGYSDVAATIPSDVNLWTFGNVATGGLGVVVDAWTGAMFEYPDTFDVAMSPGMAAPSAASPYATYSVPPPPVQAAMPVPAPRSDGKPLPGTLPDNF